MTPLRHDFAWPVMLGFRQSLQAAAAPDPASTLAAALCDSPCLASLKPGARIALAVGSRGLHAHATLVRVLVQALQQAGARPFLIPAMGSHGGATPAGQLRILADQGMTPEQLGIPFEPDMATWIIGHTRDGVPVHCADAVRQADAVVLLNRIKPHTDFGGTIGSGLLKMLVVGLGKHAGAVAFHRAAQRLGHEPTLRTMAQVALTRTPVLCGVAVIEGPDHRLAAVELIPASQLEAEETRLAAHAARLMPRLPLQDIDLLVVDRIGKNLSGTGMDPNIIGRQIHGYSLVEAHMPLHPRIRRIAVLDLTPESHGNATGIGMADFTTTRLVRAMDPQATYTNALTALSLQGSKIPIHFDTDRDVVGAALASLGLEDPARARVLRIRDTLSLAAFQASEACRVELLEQPGMTCEGAAAPLAFAEDGSLAPL